MPLKIGLNPPRALLYERIENRTHAMLDRGWRAEVESLLASSKAPRLAAAAVPILAYWPRYWPRPACAARRLACP